MSRTNDSSGGEAESSDSLADRRFVPLRLGAVRPRGWLHRQLRIQADGSGGHLDDFWPDVADNAWVGGDRDGWERGPYYADGLVPLAHLLGDERLLEKADRWVEGFLDARDESGWIGPETVAPHLDPDDPWPRFVVCKVLRRHYEATGDERALAAVRAFARHLHDNPDEWRLESWAEMRWADLAVTLQWLYDREPQPWLRNLLETVEQRGYDWITHVRSFDYPSPQPSDVHETDLQMPTHVVNNAMGLKAPAVTYRRTGDESDLAAVREGINVLDTFHGQATGVFSGDEHLAGSDPARGTELCAVVEYLYSLEYALSVSGDPRLADRVERIAYNALPATFTLDMWAHQYVQQANQVLCAVAERPWTNGPDANVFGQTPHFGCCQANFHQGWPKFAASLWMRTGDGLAAVLYGPCELEAEVAGGTVRFVVDTEYPFKDEVTVRVETAPESAFPLSLRIPGWAENAEIWLPDGETLTPDAGTFRTVAREWEDGETLTLTFNPEIIAERRHRGGVAVRRGPLVFARPVASERTQIGGERPHADWAYHPMEAWTDGLAADPEDPAAEIRLAARRSPGETPFSMEDPPITLSVPGRRVPGWTLKENAAGPIPASPAAGEGPVRDISLIPYGCTDLRITEFPLVETDP